jgi:hypothetical protein
VAINRACLQPPKFYSSHEPGRRLV